VKGMVPGTVCTGTGYRYEMMIVRRIVLCVVQSRGCSAAGGSSCPVRWEFWISFFARLYFELVAMCDTDSAESV